MKNRVKKMWVDALRSGKYEQTTDGFLRTHGEKAKYSYCCLGVLCDLYRKEEKKRWGSSLYEKDAMKDLTEYPSAKVVEWAGLSASDPVVKKGTSLSKFNDSGKTFEKIADLIEKHL